MFSDTSTKEIMDNIVNDHSQNRNIHANHYLTTLLQYTCNKIPKSTTCCWKLSKYYHNWCMKQYFVSTQYMFGIDLSSDVLCHNMDVGATFMSSMFLHCTTIPIWKDEKNERIFLSGPKDMYNFAWGSNGTTKEKS